MRVEVHDDHFLTGADDADWLQIVGPRGWVVLTKDERIAGDRSSGRRCGPRACWSSCSRRAT
jgi:hypothetical protein